MNSDLYNNDVKEEFLNTLKNESTRHVYKNIFIKTAEIEEQEGKDLYTFNLEELKDVLYTLNCTTSNSIKTYGTGLTSYVDWAISKGWRGNINPLRMFPGVWFDNFVDKTKKLYFSESEINDIVDKLVNFQDAAIVQMLFEGVSGHELSELVSLKVNDIKENNILILKDQDKTRELKVSDKCIRLIDSAIRENEYQAKNGTATGYNKTYNLMNSDYVLRTAVNKRNVAGTPDRHLIYRRLTTISEFFDYKHLNAKNISRSGMLKTAKDLYERDGKLDKEQIDEIAEKFNLNMIKGYNNKVSPNYHQISQYVNKENIEALYPPEVE